MAEKFSNLMKNYKPGTPRSRRNPDHEKYKENNIKSHQLNLLKTISNERKKILKGIEEKIHYLFTEE